MSTAREAPRSPEDLTASWLEAALGSGPVAGFEVERIGTGQMSESHRVTLDYADPDPTGPTSVVMKVAAQDETSRNTGVSMGLYEREVRFYAEVAPRAGDALAACHHASYDDDGFFCLLLGDAGPARQGDQIAGCTVEEARLALRSLARLQAPLLGDAELDASDWLNRDVPLNQALLGQLLAAFLDRYGDRVAPEHRALCERFVASFDDFLEDRPEPLGLVHGDYRLDNLLFGGPGADRPLTVVDWQTVAWGPALLDASYFLGAGLRTEDRRAHEEELLREYHAELVAQGGEGLSWDHCWREYRRQSFVGVMMAVVSPILVVATERGDQMFMTSLARHAQHAIDLDATDLLPPARTERPQPLVPDPADEGRHEPGDEELWNESWYFDAVSEDGTVGLYLRLGLSPNQGIAWYTAFVCGEGRPTVAVADLRAPLPGDDLVVATDSYRAEQVCEEPLQSYRARLEGTGAAHDDAAGLLRGDAGTPVEVAFDLVWETDGTPYGYRLAPRYEIPCRVKGTVRVGDEEIAIDAPGQRDHSWGSRDWWSMDWVWSSAHLDDGAHLHALDVRVPGAPHIGVGYVQRPGEDLYELDRVTAEETPTPDGLIESARLGLEPGGIDVEVEPVAFGPLLLTAPDGRESEFPRAMCRFACADGRRGVGWVEWNRNRARADAG